MSHDVKWTTVAEALHVLRLRIANMASIYTQYAAADSGQGTVLVLQRLTMDNNCSRNRHDKICSTGPPNERIFGMN